MTWTIPDSSYNSILINGGTGGLTTNIQANVKPLTLVGAANNDRVNIGDVNDTLQGIQGQLTITNPPLYNVVTINDTGDPVYRAAIVNVVDLPGRAEEVIVPGSATMDFLVTDTRSLNLELGSGGSTANVLATFSWFRNGVDGMTRISQQGFAVANVGDNGSMTRIEGPVTVHNSSASTTLNLDDSADPADRNATITASGITGLSPAAIDTTASSIGHLNIQGGHGIDLTTVVGTPAAVALTLNTGDGLNTLDVLATSVSSTFNGDGPVTAAVGQAGRVQNIHGSLLFTNHSPLDTALTVNNSADLISRTVTMDVSGSWGTITGLAPAAIAYEVANNDMRSVRVRGGHGSDVFYLLENADFIPTTVESGGGGDAFFVAATSAQGNLILDLAGWDYVDIGYSTGTLAPILNAVTVNGSGFGNGDTVVLDDSNNVVIESYSCYDNYLDTSTRTVLAFNNIYMLYHLPSTGWGTTTYDYHTDPFTFI